ncbi:hypothetical protein [Methyloglobulus sp.]
MKIVLAFRNRTESSDKRAATIGHLKAIAVDRGGEVLLETMIG